MLPLRDVKTEPIWVNRDMESCVIYRGTESLGCLPSSSTSKLGIPLSVCVAVLALHYVDNPRQWLFYLVQLIYFS